MSTGHTRSATMRRKVLGATSLLAIVTAIVLECAPVLAQTPQPQARGSPAPGASDGGRAAAPAPPDMAPAVDTSALPMAESSADRKAPLAAQPASQAAGQEPRPVSGATPARRAGANVTDRLELESTQITGNRELPKVLYIVPWKRPEMGDLPGRPVNSLLDEVLAPVDRDVFQRETHYYEALAAGSRRGAQPATEGMQPATAPRSAEDGRDARDEAAARGGTDIRGESNVRDEPGGRRVP